MHEKRIYDTHVVPHTGGTSRRMRRHGAQFAVLTRMRKPTRTSTARACERALRADAIEKMDLYAAGRAPERLEPDAQKCFVQACATCSRRAILPIYEGRIGASPREMRVVMLDAAQSSVYKCLSPARGARQIEQLCQRRRFEWLSRTHQAGGYHT